VNGVYSQSNRISQSGQQDDYYNAPIPLNTAQPEYRWAWVWNASNNEGSFAPNDQPGVLLAIGSYGQIRSRIVGDGTESVNDILRGRRVSIETLHQVANIAVATAPNFPNIFFDDPTYIAPLAVSRNKWIDTGLAGMRIAVTYTNGETKNYTLRQLDRLNYFTTNALANQGYGGNWASLSFIPLTRRLNEIQDVQGYFEALDPSGAPYATPLTHMSTGIAGTPGTGIGDDANVRSNWGWSDWAMQTAAATNMRFKWRGKTVDLNIPVYNRPQSLTVRSRTGQDPVIMNGYDYVYRRPEGNDDFMSKLVVSVTYIRTGDENETPATRNDVYDDIQKGICRGSIPFTAVVGTGNNPGTSLTGTVERQDGGTPWELDGGAVTNPATMPTLYSTNIWNWKDVAGDLRGQVVRTVMGTRVATVSSAGGPVSVSATPVFGDGTVSGVASTSALDLTRTRQYIAARTVNAVVAYQGYSGNPFQARRLVRNSETPIAVGVTGYVQNAPVVNSSTLGRPSDERGVTTAYPDEDWGAVVVYQGN